MSWAYKCFSETDSERSRKFYVMIIINTTKFCKFGVLLGKFNILGIMRVELMHRLDQDSVELFM
jgi:hypothetical protein